MHTKIAGENDSKMELLLDTTYTKTVLFTING